MATTFPISTYPITAATRMRDEHMVNLDEFDDGSMGTRQLSADNYRVMDIAFAPMDLSTAHTFEQYMRTNKGIEWDVTVEYGSPYTVYRGYFLGEIDIDASAGILVEFSARFRGKVV